MTETVSDSKAIVQVNALYPNFVVYGGLKEGSPSIKLTELLRHFIPDIPETDSGLEITVLNFNADTFNKIYSFEAEVHNVWSIPLGFGEPEVKLEVKSLYLFLQRISLDYSVLLAGKLALFNTEFVLSAERPLGTRYWIFTGALAEGEVIKLPEIVKQITGNSDGEGVLVESDLTRSLLNLDISKLGFSIETKPSPTMRYAFRGELKWTITFASGAELKIEGGVDIESTLPPASTPPARGSTRPATRLCSGEIRGSVAFDKLFGSGESNLFEHLEMRAVYTFKPGLKKLALILIIDAIEIQAEILQTTVNLQKQTILTISFGNTTFGDILNFLVRLVDPDIGEFELDPPWNELAALSLKGLELKINLTAKEITVLYIINQNLGFVDLQKIGFRYARTAAAPKGTVEIEIIGRIVDKTYSDTNPRRWDALNESPPATPGQGTTVFDLQYLGVGQHISFDPDTLATLTNITKVMDALQERVVPLPGKNALPPVSTSSLLQFNAESGWLIGAQFTVIDTIELNIIFNDPVIYGVRIGLRGAKAKIFAGLVFEILYRRISDTIGVYHIELVLPDAMRQLEFGAVSVTLPTVVIDIYTNGDFKLDFGFPWRFNFARSFAIDAFPFTGTGGFYFNKLSAETATSVPIITNGRFNPVIEFGIGLKIGLGKTFNKGVLKAEISITVQGILEGVIAWFYPNDPALATDQYYRIQGAVAIVGRLWGMVDFEVIQVEVEVLVRVAVVFVVEAYQPIQIVLVAEVSVRASIKILIVRIHFSFSLTIRQEFTLGSAKPTPWKLDPDQSKRKPVSGSGTGTTSTFSAASSQAFVPTSRTTTPVSLATDQAPPDNTIDVPARSVPTDAPTAASELVGEPAEETITSPENPETIEEINTASTEEIAAISSDNLAIASFEETTSFNETSTFEETIASEGTAATLEARVMAALSVAEPTPLSWQAVQIEGIPLATGEIDLFFQPTVTRSDEGPQGIGLLFIQNSIAFDSPGTTSYKQDANNDTDFDQLVQYLLTWAIDAYFVQAGTSATIDDRSISVNDYSAISLTDLQNLYDMFVRSEQDQEAPFSFDQLLAFLQRNFKFNITVFSDNTSGTLFPVFPKLRMQVGSTTVAFDGREFLLDAGDRQDFAAYFRQLKGDHGSTVERGLDESNPSSSGGSDSVSAFIFVDYFSLLIRSAVQSAIEHTQRRLDTVNAARSSEETPIETISLASLLEGLNRDGSFNHIAGMASRFLLHGLRLPDWDDALASQRGNPDRPTVPLFKATGQQFPLTIASGAVTPNQVTFSYPETVSWLKFNKLGNSLAYPFPTELVALINDLNNVTGQRIKEANFLPLDPLPLPTYNDVNRRFNLRQKADWSRLDQGKTTSSPFTVVDLPDDLRDYQEIKFLPTRLRNRAANENEVDRGLKLALKYGKPPKKQGTPAGRTEFDRTELRPEDITEIKTITWATKVQLTVRRVSNQTGTALLDRTYLMVGTDEEGKDRLEDLWQHLRHPTTRSNGTVAKLYLLHSAIGRDVRGEKLEGVVNRLPVEQLLLKTNLSTYSSHPMQSDDSLYIANLNNTSNLRTEIENFLQLIWEGSTVNTGGYHLRYGVDEIDGGETKRKGLPTELFTDGLNASLVLLVVLESDSKTLPLYHFQNCIVLPGALNLEEGVLYAESDDKVKALSLPAGNVGFKQVRPVAIVDRNNQTGEDELQSLYQMLGYQMLDTEDFKASNEGLPISPAELNQDYTVKAGDTLFKIADSLIQKTGNTTIDNATRQHKLAQITEKNAELPNVFVVGTRINFGGNQNYTIKQHDSLNLIAQSTQKTIQEIVVAVQNLENAMTIGMVLQVITDDWLYERVLPVYKRAKTRHTLSANKLPARLQALPSNERDPYAGIDANAQVKLKFSWLDVYGNRLIPEGKVKSFNVRYFDRLLGINQWPTVVESYQFKKIPGNLKQVELIVELVFDQSAYIAAAGRPFTEVAQKVRTARATYEQVYYQIHQADVSFTARTSVLPQFSHQLTVAQKKQLTDFVEAAYLYLSTMEALQPFTHVSQAGETLATISTTYHVEIRTLATANADTSGLFASGQSLQIGDRTYTVQANESLRVIEQALPDDVAQTVADIAVQNATVRLNSGIKLIVPDRVAISTHSPFTAAIPTTTTSLTSLTTRLLTERQTIEEAGTFTAADLAIANQNIIGLLKANQPIFPNNISDDILADTLNQNSSPNLDLEDWKRIVKDNVIIHANETLSTLASRFANKVKREEKPNPVVTVADVASAIASTTDLLVPGQMVIIPPVSLRQAGSSHLSVLCDRIIKDSQNQDKLGYPADLIFPVMVQIDMTRNQSFVQQELLPTVPEIQAITAFLTPKTTPLAADLVGTSEQIASLQEFAKAFEAAFPGLGKSVLGLRLAVGNELPHKHSPAVPDLDNPTSQQIFQPLWAVHFGSNGIHYNVREELPYFFSLVPLSNTLLAGSVNLSQYQSGRGLTNLAGAKQVEAIDLNVLARDFLSAVEEFLSPAIAIPAIQLGPQTANNVQTILKHKETLADAIQTQVKPILEFSGDISEQRQVAADNLRQQLLLNLVEAFDIETIVQFGVDVNLATNPGWAINTAPRLSGQPIIQAVKRTSNPSETINPETLDFTLSPAKAPLRQGSSYLTFFFNTKTPEKYEDITLEIVYRVKELEHDIIDVKGISNYQASSWLSFILPIDGIEPSEPNYIGNVPIPIPLRTYPIPPSLVLHRAEADPDSLERLQDIRQWQYTFVYEHLDIAQDAIESKVHYNEAPSDRLGSGKAGTNVDPSQQSLFAALVNFANVYPQLLPDLQLLVGEKTQDQANQIIAAVTAFTQLVGDVATDWKRWRDRIAQNAAPMVSLPTDYIINEEDREEEEDGSLIAFKDVTVDITVSNSLQSFPDVTVPGYGSAACRLPKQDKTIIYEFQQKSREEAALDPVFGESSIPDRILTVPDRDIINQQNAWGAIWLTRNKQLLLSKKTNPEFIFQTPEVRFSSLITPLLINSQRWDIAAIGSPNPQRLPLEDHLRHLFTTLLPAHPEQAYDIRVACRYAFALALAGNAQDDLLSTLPVVLGPRASIDAGENPDTATAGLRSQLIQDIKKWYQAKEPVATKAMFVFSVSIFSHIQSSGASSENANLPLLCVEHLGLLVEQIADLKDSANE